MGLRKTLINNQLSVGSWVTIGHPNVVEIMATAGFDWLVVDMEHTSIDLGVAQVLISLIQANNMSALVRVAQNEEVIIKKVLDMGADGIIVPMVNSAQDARRAVGYAQYPPAGMRGVGLYRAQGYGTQFEAYQRKVQEDIAVIVQIEHIDAVRDIQQIMQVPGVDAAIIGPYDLSASMGHPGRFERPDVQQAIADVIKHCTCIQKPVGFHVIDSDPNSLIAKINEGCLFLAYSLDFFFLGDSARAGMKRICAAVQS